MRRLIAGTAEELRELPVEDAWFDSDDVVHDPLPSTVVVPFAQEPLVWQSEDASGVRQYDVVRRTRWTTRYRVPLMACELTIRHVVGVRADDWFHDAGSLASLDFDATRHEVLVHLVPAGVLAVEVSAIDVEATMSDDVAMHIQRDVGPFGERDKGWG